MCFYPFIHLVPFFCQIVLNDLFNLKSRKKKSPLNPSVFKYKIRLVKTENGETQLVKAAQLW